MFYVCTKVAQGGGHKTSRLMREVLKVAQEFQRSSNNIGKSMDGVAKIQMYATFSIQILLVYKRSYVLMLGIPLGPVMNWR
jgi:hypothetical protein